MVWKNGEKKYTLDNKKQEINCTCTSNVKVPCTSKCIRQFWCLPTNMYICFLEAFKKVFQICLNHVYHFALFYLNNILSSYLLSDSTFPLLLSIVVRLLLIEVTIVSLSRLDSTLWNKYVDDYIGFTLKMSPRIHGLFSAETHSYFDSIR